MTKRQNRLLSAEGLLLAFVVAPLLLFPTVSVTATTGVVLLLLCLWVVEWFAARIPVLPPTPLNIAFAVWWLTVLIGIVVSADPDQTLPKATGLLLGFAVWRYFVHFLRSGRRFRFGIAIFLATSMSITLFGAFSADWQLKVPILTTVLDLLPAQLLRLPGAPDTGVHTNELGGTITIFLPLLLALLFGRRSLNLKPFTTAVLAILTVITAVILILTQSRSAWIGVLGGIFVLAAVWWFMLPKSRLKTGILTTLIVLAVVGLALLTQVDSSQFSALLRDPPRETAVGTLTTIAFRREMWGAALQIMQDTPFTGSGLGAFRRVVPRLYPALSTNSGDIAHAHNIFLQVATDVGAFGLAAYVAILLLTFGLCAKLVHFRDEFWVVVVGLAAGLIGLHLFGMTDAIAPGAKPGVLLWMALGLVCVRFVTATDDVSAEQSDNPHTDSPPDA